MSVCGFFSLYLHLTITGGRAVVGSESALTHTQKGSLCVETLAVGVTELRFIRTLINIWERRYEMQ